MDRYCWKLLMTLPDGVRVYMDAFTGGVAVAADGVPTPDAMPSGVEFFDFNPLVNAIKHLPRGEIIFPTVKSDGTVSAIGLPINEASKNLMRLCHEGALQSPVVFSRVYGDTVVQDSPQAVAAAAERLGISPDELVRHLRGLGLADLMVTVEYAMRRIGAYVDGEYEDNPDVESAEDVLEEVILDLKRFIPAYPEWSEALGPEAQSGGQTPGMEG